MCATHKQPRAERAFAQNAATSESLLVRLAHAVHARPPEAQQAVAALHAPVALAMAHYAHPHAAHAATTARFPTPSRQLAASQPLPTNHTARQVWPTLVDYFYTDSITLAEDNVVALLALARQLLVHSVDDFCGDFVTRHLSTHNCLAYLRQAVKYHTGDIQQQCVALAAQGEHAVPGWAPFAWPVFKDAPCSAARCAGDVHLPPAAGAACCPLVPVLAR